MSCCGSTNKNNQVERKGNTEDMNYDQNHEKKQGVGKFLLTLLHLSILAIIISSDRIQILQDNLKYIIIGYVVLFVVILMTGNRRKVE
jgi:hypothetical protein